MQNVQRIVIVDFGAQYTQLIARRVREAKVFCEVIPYTSTLEEIRSRECVGIILSGGPASVLDEDAPRIDPGVYELGVPVILHIRDAHGDALDILRARKDRLTDMVLHCCTASWESAKVYLSLGCRISFTGPVTFKRSVNLQEVAKNVPLDRLMIETDSPYLAPEPVRGRRNDPRNVAHICRFIAQLRGMEAQTLADATRENAKAFYRIP